MDNIISHKKIRKILNDYKKVNTFFLIFIFSVFFTFGTKSQNCQIIDTAIVTNVNCFGDATGSIELFMLDTLVPYSYTWNNLQTDQNIYNLTSASYNVIITDITNPSCIQDTTFIITQPQDPLTSTVNLYQDVDCFGDSTGVAYADAIGGTFPYTYLWSNGQTTQMANSLWGDPSGQGIPFTHSVTITDNLGCTLVDFVDIVNSHAEISGTLEVLEQVSCFSACDGIAQLSSIGGVLQHTYFWDNGQTYIGSGPDTAYNLCFGGHNIIIEDALGCRKTIPFIITQPDELFAQAEQVQPVQCYGFDDGIAFSSATGGTTPYLFVWDDPVSGPTGQDIDSLTPGIHVVYVTDANGCTASDTVVISEPTQLEVVIVDSMTIYSYCAGTNSGQLCALASGGTPNYNYLWNDGLNQNTSCAYNLSAQFNDYTVIVMDERNCIASASFQLDSITNSMNTDSVLIDISHVSCFGIYDGSINVNSVPGGFGGVAPYTYTWNGPGTYTGIGDYISSLYAGNYAVVIEDTNGCAITINADVNEPDQLEYTTYNVIGETCYGANDGQIWVNVTGGTGNYYYDVSEVGAFPIPNANQVVLTNDSLITDLSQGMHSIYITDDNNCEGAVVWGGKWMEEVDSGVVVSLTGVVTSDASCFNTNDGQAWIQWPGADPLFNYTWETDPVGTVIDTGINTNILYPGNYNLVVHYADSASFGQNYSGCDLIQPFTIGSPTPLVSGAVVIDEKCFDGSDGSIELNPSGSNSPYSVVWDTTTSVPVNSTAFVQSPLQPGVYTATITDASGCEITEDYTVAEADPITAAISFISPSCFGLSDGSATITTSGGTQPYIYNWSNGGNSATAVGLSANIYTANVLDANGCPASFSVTVTEPEQLIANVEATIFYNADENGNPYHISCFGLSDGAAAVTNGGGVEPITYSWTPTPSNSAIATGLSAGTNTVTVTDANGCVETATIDLNQPNLLEPNLFENIYSTSTNGITNEISCYGANDGWLQSIPTGGVVSNVGYQYIWKQDNTGITISSESMAENLQANSSYTVFVTDANNCVSTETSTILDEPVPFIADVTTTNYGGPMHAEFSVEFTDATISNDPFDFNWTWMDGTSYFSNGTLNMNHIFTNDNIGQNNVYVIVTNLATGCTDSVPFVIDVQGIPEVDNVFTPNGDNVNDYFSFDAYGMSYIDISIYNRWGQLVSAWSGMNKKWDGLGIDGKELPEGAYFYTLIAEGEDGHYYEYKGSITLIR